MMAGMIQTDLHSPIEAQSMDAKREAYKARKEKAAEPPPNAKIDRCAGACSDRGGNSRMLDDVLALKRRDRRRSAGPRRIAQPSTKPRLGAAQRRLDQLQQEYNDLWETKYPEILGRLTDPIGDAQTLASIEELEQKVDGLKKIKEKQAKLFQAMQLEQKATNDDLLALRTKDDDKKKDDDDKEDKDRDVAERLQDQLKDLLDKLGKELTPVTEEVRKALARAVGEIHQSLEKEGLSPESLGKALEKSQEDLRKAFEEGGAVDKELREAIDRGSQRHAGRVRSHERRCPGSS